MEKKDLLGVRTKPVTARRRRKVSAAAAAGGGGRRLAKAIADYLASDSYMYAVCLAGFRPSAAAASTARGSAYPSFSCFCRERSVSGAEIQRLLARYAVS